MSCRQRRVELFECAVDRSGDGVIVFLTGGWNGLSVLLTGGWDSLSVLSTEMLMERLSVLWTEVGGTV